MNMTIRVVSIFAVLSPSIAMAQQGGVKAVRDVLDCRKVEDATARLSCFEGAAGALAEATGQGDVVVLDKEAVRRARRELFGFSVAAPELFAKGAGAKVEEVSELASTVSALRRNRDGNYVVTLAQGGQWEQITAGSFGQAPQVGMSVTVWRAALGSYKMKLGNSPAVKARRIG